MVKRKNAIQKVVWIYLMAFALVAFSFHSEAQTESMKTTESTEATTTTNKKTTKKESKISQEKKAKETFAEIQTSLGTFKVAFFQDRAPKTVENFVGLAEGTKEWTDPKSNKKVKKPYYEGVVFHRIIDGFMIQGGDPTGTGMGGPGYEFEDEIKPGTKYDKKGIVAMANKGPNTNGSQFFITLAPQPGLDPNYTVFGEVVEGQDVVDKIGKVKTGPGDRPVEPVVIKKVKITRK